MADSDLRSIRPLKIVTVKMIQGLRLIPSYNANAAKNKMMMVTLIGGGVLLMAFWEQKLS